MDNLAISFINTLHQCSKGEATAEDLAESMLQFQKAFPAQTAFIEQQLTKYFNTGKLPSQTYFKLKAQLATEQDAGAADADDATIIAPKEVSSDDATIIAPKTGVSSDDATIIAPKTGVSSDDATIIAPKTGVSSDDATIIAPKTGVSSDDATIIAPKTGVSSDDATIVAPKTGVSSDDATIIAPKTGVSSDDATIIAPKTGVSSDDATIVAPKAEVSSDDATIIAPKIAISSTDETIVDSHSSAATKHSVLQQSSIQSEDDSTHLYSPEAGSDISTDTTIAAGAAPYAGGDEATLVDDTLSNEAPGTPIPGAQAIHTAKTAKTSGFTTSGTTAISGTKFDRHPLGIGSVLKDRFILEEVLGSGGMGVVYKALDLRKQEAQDKSPYVALKILNDDIKNDATAFIALQRETKKAQTLAHPNIITVYDFDRDQSHVFMSMEILAGQSLSSYITKQAPNGLPFKKAWNIINGLCQALAYAHKHDIVHSDFKPGNVSISEEGEVKVLDFGIACAVSRHDKDGDETIFDARRDLGALTPAYASLEMFGHGEPDPSDDVYALACVCYEILSGKHPFGKLPAPKAFELRLQPKPIPGLSRRQWKALLHGLAFEKKNRTSSVNQFMEEIRPKSMLPLVLSAVAIIAVIGSGGYMYKLSQQKVDPLEEKIIALTPEQQLKVKDFLELAEMHIEVGYLTAPTGSNAVWAYRQALEIDPYNKEAKKGLEKIANIVMQEAGKLYEEGKTDQSLNKVEEGLEALPGHEGLLALKAKIMHN